MLIELKMCRFENVPWGFRLVGGTDFEIPLTVVKVTEGSIADQTGMRVGDIVVRINDDPTSGLTHNEAHSVLSQCGNVFFLGLIREELDIEENDKENCLPCCDSVEPPMSCTPDSMLASSMKSPISEMSDKRFEALSEISSDVEKDLIKVKDSEPNHTNDDSLKTEEDDIAALMSGEAEILKDHNVIGVNFNRIFPKPGVCASSEVLRQLNEEAIKTKLEKEKERKKWTTFLQKPDRPIPKSKAQIEAEKQAATAYKVCIVKQPKREDRPITPVPEPVREPSPVPEEPVVEIEPEVEEEPPADSEVPNLENAPKQNGDEKLSNEDFNTETAQEEDAGSIDENAETNEEVRIDEEHQEHEEEIVEKTEEELILEKQLASVQQQLLALSSLPSTIQATLDAVTKQLGELLPNFKLQTQSNEATDIERKESSTGNNDDDIDDLLTTDENDALTSHGHELEKDPDTNQNENEELIEEITSVDDNNNQQSLEEVEQSESTFVNIKSQQQMEEEQQLQAELTHKKQKEHGVIEELEQRIKRENLSKGPKRAFGPLTPQQRPQILPGGRRWYRPKDAYNDDFIAETLSAQAELIVGSTLGSTYESPLLGYDEREFNSSSVAIQLEKSRVNFMKYQKPEKKIDLEKSEVYKVVHHLDKAPIRGIEIRPPVVPAEEDIRNRATPISCS